MIIINCLFGHARHNLIPLFNIMKIFDSVRQSIDVMSGDQVIETGAVLAVLEESNWIIGCQAIIQEL